MFDLFIMALIAIAALAYVYHRLAQTNMIVPEGAERRLPPRDALRFALDNDLPLRIY